MQSALSSDMSLIRRELNCLSRYFGGSLKLVSLNGWGELKSFLLVTLPFIYPGCDVFLKLRCLDEAGDARI
jgi:hypothetical protein